MMTLVARPVKEVQVDRDELKRELRKYRAIGAYREAGGTMDGPPKEEGSVTITGVDDNPRFAYISNEVTDRFMESPCVFLTDVHDDRFGYLVETRPERTTMYEVVADDGTDVDSDRYMIHATVTVTVLDCGV